MRGRLLEKCGDKPRQFRNGLGLAVPRRIRSRFFVGPSAIFSPPSG